MQKITFLGFSVFFALSLCLYPPVVSMPQDYTSRLVETEAVAPIKNNDVEMAKNLAIFEAKRKAIEPLGIQIDSETIYSMGLQIADWYKIKVGGYIKDWELLPEESGRIDGGYKAKIRAWVKCGEEEKDVTKNFLSLRKILVISEGNGSSIIEDFLILELNKLGYRYHDSEFIRNNVSPATWASLIHRRILSLDDDAFKFMADLVVYIKSSLEFRRRSSTFPGSWFRGEARILLFQISGEQKGEAVIEIFQESNRLFGSGEGSIEQHKADALTTSHPNGFKRQIGRPIISNFMKRLMDNKLFKVRDRAITVRITNVPTQGEFKRFLTIVKHQRGVQSRVSVLKQEAGTYTLNVTFPMKTIYLAYLLSASRSYRLIGHDWNRIELEYQRR